MLQIVWLDINASYTHTSLALPLLHLACEDSVKADWHRVKGTIKSDAGELAAAVAAENPDVILSTLYLFNHEFATKVLRRAAVLLKNPRVILGGPEFLGDNRHFLTCNPYVTAVCRGPGESCLPQLLDRLDTPAQWSAIPRLCWFDDDHTYHDNGSNADSTPVWQSFRSPSASPFFIWDQPFIQLETMRGCPHRCSFCTSCRSGPLQWLDPADIRTRLDEARSHGIREIRVLDRTFNAKEGPALERLQLFREEYADLRFHLEIHPGLLTDDLRTALAAAPPDQLHIEVGVQSTQAAPLAACKRTGDPDAMLEAVGFLCDLDNLQVHCDLLSGLPQQSLADVYQDLARLVALGPEEIQLEILKILPGTPIAEHCREYGIFFAPDPAYEVLATATASAADLLESLELSRLIDQYYNTPQLRDTVIEAWQLVREFPQLFLCFLRDRTDLQPGTSLNRRGQLLYEFLEKMDSGLADKFAYRWLQHGLPPAKLPIQAKRWRRPLPIDVNLIDGEIPAESRPDQVIWHLRRRRDENWFLFADRRLGRGPIAIVRRRRH